MFTTRIAPAFAVAQSIPQTTVDHVPFPFASIDLTA
jgi:hypothetical protein